MKKFVSLVLVLVMVLASAPVSAADDAVTITILHTNDVHSRVVGSEKAIGYARLATLLQNMRRENRNIVLVDAGDALHGQTIATISKGQPIVDLMNEVGYDIMAAGNHDFNYGYERLLELEKSMQFDLLSANVRDKADNPIMKSLVIKNIGGVRVGFFGLTTPETAYKTNVLNVAGLTFADPIETAKRVVAFLDDRTDVIVCVGHIGIDEETEIKSRDILNAVPEIDVFVDGHSHTTLENGERVGNALLVQAGEYSKHVGVVELKVVNGIVVDKSARLISPADVEKLEPNKRVLERIDAINEANKVVTEVHVATIDEELDGLREHVRTGETNLGNLIADAMLADGGADVAITNGGGIRASIAPGEVKMGDIITVLPFGNYIVKLEMTGRAIAEALENGIADYPGAKGGFPHVAGMTYSFDPSKPVGGKLISVMVGGQPLHMDKTYIVATNDFLALGGDQYKSMATSRKVGESIALDEAVIRYMQRPDFRIPKVEGRITVKSAGSIYMPDPGSPGLPPIPSDPVIPIPIPIPIPSPVPPPQTR